MKSDENQREQLPYVAYRSESDAYFVEFSGGPLDGARIVTDVRPDTDCFAHRHRGRCYTYRYQQIGPTRFVAQLASFGEPVRPEESTRGFTGLLVESWSRCIQCVQGTTRRLAGWAKKRRSNSVDVDD